MERVNMNCQLCQFALSDLLLDPTAPAAAAAAVHLETCVSCRTEHQALQSTFDLLDGWAVPPLSPYFDQKLTVRLREEQANPPAGFFERLRSRLLFNTGRQFRPAMTGALALLLLLGGGTVATISPFGPRETSATVRDLQILDKNDQALQTMDQLLQEDGSSDDAPAVTPST